MASSVIPKPHNGVEVLSKPFSGTTNSAGNLLNVISGGKIIAVEVNQTNAVGTGYNNVHISFINAANKSYYNNTAVSGTVWYVSN